MYNYTAVACTDCPCFDLFVFAQELYTVLSVNLLYSQAYFVCVKSSHIYTRCSQTDNPKNVFRNDLVDDS